MAGHEHIEITETDDHQWTYRRIYANGRRGERSEEKLTEKRYAIERVLTEHPSDRVRVVPLEHEAYWIEPVEPADEP